jgi:hypothetical protein
MPPSPDMLHASYRLMQAEHEAGVTSVAVAPDGLRVAIGTESGALGVLDIPSHHYTTLLRSHVGRVNGVVADPVRYADTLSTCIAVYCLTVFRGEPAHLPHTSPSVRYC